MITVLKKCIVFMLILFQANRQSGNSGDSAIKCWFVREISRPNMTIENCARQNSCLACHQQT